MSRSAYPSKVNLSVNLGQYATVVDFLIARFPAIAAEQWHQRADAGYLHYEDGSLIASNTPYLKGPWVYYYREVEQEPEIPFDEEIVYQDEHILVAYKPHFLPVMPGGNYVNQCLQNRLRKRTGIDDLIALHRLDRETAGLLMFSHNRESRPLYHRLFSDKTLQKSYQAISAVTDEKPEVGQSWQIKNRLVKSDPAFLMQVAEGEANSHSEIRCVQSNNTRALFELQPVTGKTHQLRVHMLSLGWPILYDRFYPLLKPKNTDVYDQPLQLLAKGLRFIDPVSGEQRDIQWSQNLTL